MKDILPLIFESCDLASQKAIANTSRDWHSMMFVIRERKAQERLNQLGPTYQDQQSDITYQQQYYEKMLLLDIRAQRLSDWFTPTPPNPKYSGRYIALGLASGGTQIFRSFASHDMERNVFPDEQFFPHVVIERAIKVYGFTHDAVCPLDDLETRFLSVLAASNMPHILQDYLEYFGDAVEINYRDLDSETALQIAFYEQPQAEKSPIVVILAKYSSILSTDEIQEIYSNIKDAEEFNIDQWAVIENYLKINARASLRV